MRYYDIKFNDPDGNLLQTFGQARQGASSTYTSFLGNATIPGALNIEFNIPQAPFAIPQQGSMLRIWGVGIDELANSNQLSPFIDADGNLQLNGIVISGGMQKGLPLAKPAQAGVLVDGSIFQPIGNWQGTQQYIEMVLLPAVGVTTGQPINIPWVCPANTPFQTALEQALAVFTTYKVNVVVSPQLKLNYDSTSVPYTSLSQFAAMILKLSKGFTGISTLGGGQYAGVMIRVIGKTITAYDNSAEYNTKNTSTNPLAIAFEDIIGQPTWIGPATVSVKTVLRADVQVGDFVTLPQTLSIPYVLSVPGSSVPGAPSRSSAAFQGNWIVITKRDFGNFRNPSADSWCSVMNMSTVLQPGAFISGINAAIPPGKVIVGQPTKAQ